MRSGPFGRGMRGMRVLLVAAILSLTAAGCVSMPSGGPVLSYPVTQGTNGQAQPYLQIVPPSPGQDWTPTQIVEGFLTASASFVGQQRVARDYLTPKASSGWKPSYGAIVFTNSPVVKSVAGRRPANQDTASVTIAFSPGDIQATLSPSGTYDVAAPLPKGRTFRYDLVKYYGQWRISNLYRNPLLLTTTEFTADYQLRNLYFFAPTSNSLVPDPVYVPFQATQADLVNGLVRDLITQPPDFLNYGATRNAFPKGTSLVGNVTVDGGTASVTLGGAATRVSDAIKEQISSQLWWTLNGAGQGQQQVLSIALSIGGKAFEPQGSAVQNHVTYAPANNPRGGVFYYLGTGGQLMRVTEPAGKLVKVARIGAGYTGLAVSPDGEYVAALRGGNIYTGEVGASRLTFRNVGGGFTSLSWDKDDNLWAAGSAGVVTLSATAKPVDASAPVDILNQNRGEACPSGPCDVTVVRVAPDGVRIALVFGGQQQALAFGAIVMADQSAAVQAPPVASVQLSPFVVSPLGASPPGAAFKALSWYGAEDVIALTEPGDTLTEYPVNGGTATPVQGPPGMRSVAAYFDGKVGGLVAGLGNGTMSVDTSISGAWSSLDYKGQFPVYPG